MSSPIPITTTFHSNKLSNHCQKVMAVITIASAILACVSLGFAIQAYLNPSGYLIGQISGFPVTSSMVMWSAIFLTSSGYFIYQSIRKNGLSKQLSSITPSCIAQRMRSLIGSAGRETVFDESERERGSYPEYIVEFPSLDPTKESIRGHWFPQADIESRSTVILISGYTQHLSMNVEGLPDQHHMSAWVDYYHFCLGMNVCLVDLRGFGLNQGLNCTSEEMELNAYHDACSALNFILEQNVNPDRIVVHGYSQGGPVASTLAALFPQIHTVVLDRSYPTIEDVMVLRGRLITGIRFPHSLFKVLNTAAFPTHELTFRDRRILTNGWNTKERVRQLRNRIFVIEGDEDRLMPSTRDLIRLRYGQIRDENYLLLPGGHLYSLSSPAEADQLRHHLHRHALIEI